MSAVVADVVLERVVDRAGSRSGLQGAVDDAVPGLLDGRRERADDLAAALPRAGLWASPTDAAMMSAVAEIAAAIDTGRRKVM